ncbi:MAG: ATP-grasp domain-containing protein [Nostocaceae cyanobacterium]|nr:ATP-grasp domain-containing protein [Nostocaceae cyanobacterium]
MARQKIFNHDIMNCTHESVLGNKFYSARVLGLSGSQDIIQLHPDLRSQWNAICEHYARIGLSHSQDVIWDVSLSILDNYPNYDASVFFFGCATEGSDFDEDWFRNRDADWLNVVKSMNSKNSFIQIAQELGVKVPKTLCFPNKSAIKNLEDFPYPCYLKPAVAVDGAGIRRCANQQQLTIALDSLEDWVPLQIQQEVIASTFLNLQYQVTDTGVQRLAATEQVLDGYAHIGNRYPTKHQPWELVQPLAEWMAQRGMKDIFAFDVAVVENGTQTEYFAIECNPRFNGASYPTGIAQKLNIDSWTSETFNTEYRSLERLDLRGIEFNPQTNTGVVLVNWGSILVSRIAVLLAGNIAQQNQLRTILKQRLMGKVLSAGC